MRAQASYYAVLGVDPKATAAEIFEAARRLNASFPESARDPSTNPAYGQLLQAYEVLKDPKQRAAYDIQLERESRTLLEVSIHASRHTMGAMEAEQILYLLVDVRAPGEGKSEPLPLNLALVFDRSTSMQGERLERLKAAARHVVERLSRQDRVAIVAFSDRAEVIVPSGNIDSKMLLVGRIASMTASGGTEIYQGLKTGLRELRTAPVGDYVNHLILMTDGHTYGDEEACLALAQEAAHSHVSFSAFGIGADWNDQFLDQLVTPSGGHSAYIEDPADIVDHLEEQIQGLGATYAQNVRLLNELPSGVDFRYLIKFSPFTQPLNWRVPEIKLGAVEQRVPLSILMELAIGPQSLGRQLRLPVQLRADIPCYHEENRAFNYHHTVKVVPGEPKMSPPKVVVQAVQMLNLYRMNEKAWKASERGDVDAARQRMERLTTRLTEAGETTLAQQAMMETQRLSRMGALSPEGRKKLKYGTRTLLTETMKAEKDD